MNIFALSRNPVEAAQQMLDKHIIKMPTETCQMLHTNILYMQYVKEHGKEPQLKDLKAFHLATESKLMKPAMLNHPSTIWARQTYANWNWLYEHGLALCDEYTYRYEKKHGTLQRILDCIPYFDVVFEHNFPKKRLQPVSIAMDDQYRIPNPMDIPNWDFVIESYRHYYLEGKWRIAEWRKNRRPDWFPANHYAKKYNIGVRAYNARKPRYPQQLMEE
mgnify:FL=1|tara:strand:- start:3313 stop:3966 length:654 start_codon:yes stop_codon:yes gene_type:complete